MTVPSTISAPRYDAAAVVPSVVHLGLGAFHRAHQAAYADDVLATGSLSGGICAVSLRNSALPAALSRPGFRYHVVETDNAGDRVRAISSIRQALSAGSHGMAAVIDRLADPRIEVVTITVTEKGYCAVGATGDLDLDRDEVAHDLLHPAQPQSMPGVLVEALARRRVAGVAPFSVCSCDNIRSNGATTRRVVTQLAAHRGDDLADWIAGEVAFPSSMVDRMVPHPTQQLRETVRDLTQTDDECAVAAEPFSQWVIEDTFPGGRPPWERVGVDFVSDVTRYELAKVRILNGAHSALAYFGLLAGHTKIDQAAADPRLAPVVRLMLLDEVLPTLAPPPGVDLERYVDSSLARFTNGQLGYTTHKVAGDGAGKLPGRILGTISDRLRAGGPVERLALVVAAYAIGLLAPPARRRARAHPTLQRLIGPALKSTAPAAEAVDRLLSLEEIFGRDLASAPQFRTAVHRHAELLWRGELSLALARTGKVPGDSACS